MTSYKANGGNYGITEDERQIILGYREEAGKTLNDTLGWSDDEIYALYDEALEDDWLSVIPFYDKAEEMLK